MRSGPRIGVNPPPITPRPAPAAGPPAKRAAGRPPERISVLIRRRNRDLPFDVEWVEERLVWPKGWPLPDVGSVVSAGPLSGFVEHLEFDLDAQVVLVVLR